MCEFVRDSHWIQLSRPPEQLFVLKPNDPLARPFTLLDNDWRRLRSLVAWRVETLGVDSLLRQVLE